MFHVGGFLAATLTFVFASGIGLLFVVLPIFGFLTLGMHAGYAIYFPELFPTRLRSTGAGICFNLARVAVFPFLFFIGWLQRPVDKGGLALGLEHASALISLLFLAGAALLYFAVETKGQDLPE